MDAKTPWEPQLDEFVRILHDVHYRRIPSPGEGHLLTSWEGQVGQIIGLDFGEKVATVQCDSFIGGDCSDFPFDDIMPLDRLKRPEGAEDGAWVQIRGGKYDGVLAQIRGWDRGRLHIQRASGPVEAYLPEELDLLRGMDVADVQRPVGLDGADSYTRFERDAEQYVRWRTLGSFSAPPAPPAPRSPREVIAHALTLEPGWDGIHSVPPTPETAATALRVLDIGASCGFSETRCCVSVTNAGNFWIRYGVQPVIDGEGPALPWGSFRLHNATEIYAVTSTTIPTFTESRACETTDESLRAMFDWIRGFFIEEGRRTDGDKA